MQNCPTCDAECDVSGLQKYSEVACPDCGEDFIVAPKFDRFELLSTLRRTLVGSVYKAYDPETSDTIAVLLIPKEELPDALVPEVEKEASAAAALDHPNIVKLVGLGMFEDYFYMVMELTEGGSLESILKSRKKLGEGLAVDYAIQVANALQYAAKHGLSHGDIQPGNILLDDEQTTKLTGFGISGLERAHAQRTGSRRGTPGYASPEAAAGRAVDDRSDIYSFGASFFHALVGRAPTPADLAALNSAGRSGLKSVAPDISAPTADVLNRALMQDPGARYQNYDELIEHLEFSRGELMESGHVDPEPVEAVETEAPAGAAHAVGDSTATSTGPSPALIGIGVVILILALFFILHHGSKPKSDVAQPAVAVAPTEPPRPAATPIPTETVFGVSGVAPATASAFETARQAFISGKFDTAESSFAQIAGDKSVPADLRSWSLIHEGISNLADGKHLEGQAAFAALQHQGGDPLFKQIAEIGAAERPVAADNMDTRTGSAIGFLVAGLKDASFGDLPSAGNAFRQFIASSPEGAAEPISNYKPLASKFAADVQTMQSAEAAVRATKGTPEFRSSVENLRKTAASMPKAFKAQDAAEKFITENTATPAATSSIIPPGAVQPEPKPAATPKPAPVVQNVPPPAPVAPPPVPKNEVYVEDLDLANAHQEFGKPQAGKSTEGNPIKIDGQTFDHGIGTRANSEILIDLKGAALRFKAQAGLDDEKQRGSLSFAVIVDGQTAAETPVLKHGQPPVPINVDLTGKKTLELRVTHGGNGARDDDADWADAVIQLADGAAEKPVTKPASGRKRH